MRTAQCRLTKIIEKSFNTVTKCPNFLDPASLWELVTSAPARRRTGIHIIWFLHEFHFLAIKIEFLQKELNRPQSERKIDSRGNMVFALGGQSLLDNAMYCIPEVIWFRVVRSWKIKSEKSANRLVQSSDYNRPIRSMICGKSHTVICSNQRSERTLIFQSAAPMVQFATFQNIMQDPVNAKQKR
jgi:hypothetical protein